MNVYLYIVNLVYIMYIIRRLTTIYGIASEHRPQACWGTVLSLGWTILHTLLD